MSKITNKQIELFKRIWKKTVLILLAISIALCTVAVYNRAETDTLEDSVQTLSKLGSRGDEVRRVQQKLKQLGYYKGSVDGIFGVQTQTAVKAFQRNCGLTVDGIAGPKTLLYLGLSGGSTTSTGTSSDLNLLARLISAEARGESYTGQVAVGAVVLNRVRHSSFPDTISGVIYQSGAFSCVNTSNWYASVSDSSKKAAQDALNGWDPSGGAIYYYNPAKTTNSWMLSRPVVKVIGNHRFCL